MLRWHCMPHLLTVPRFRCLGRVLFWPWCCSVDSSSPQMTFQTITRGFSKWLLKCFAASFVAYVCPRTTCFVRGAMRCRILSSDWNVFIVSSYSNFSWWNPFAWAYRALVVNEFRQGRWDNPDNILQENGFVDPSGTVFGQVWVGYSFLYLVPYWLLCCVLSAMGLSCVQHSSHATADVVAKPHGTRVEGMKSIPFKPVTLTFHDVCYTVTASTSKTQLKLLKNVNGIFRSGRLCALMVSSVRFQIRHCLAEDQLFLFSSSFM